MRSDSPSGRPVLVTGGTGFMGPRLCRHLVDRGAEVHAVSRSAEPGEREDVRWWSADLTVEGEAARLLEETGAEVIFHLAGLAAGSRDPELVLPTFRSNLATTVHTLAAAADVGCARFVLAGSMEEPTEGGPEVVPSSPYAASKWAASAYARMYNALFDVPAVVARVFMVYGPGVQDEQKLIPYVIRSLLGGEEPELTAGDRPIDWVYQDDVARGLARLATAPGVEGKTVDIGSGETATVRELVEELADIVGGEARPRFGARPSRSMEQVEVADVEGTRELLGWAPEVPLEEGLRRTVEWYAERSGCENEPTLR